MRGRLHVYTAETAPDGFPAVPRWDPATALTLPDMPAVTSNWLHSADTLDMPVVRSKPKIIALIPAHNEAADIANTITSLLRQTRPVDLVIVISDNSTDDTVRIASRFPVIVIETEGNTHRKSGALNQAWWQFCQDADIIVCADGDTELPPHAVQDWEREFSGNSQLGGSSSQPVMTGSGYLSRLQRFEFTMSATQSLVRGWCRVVSGTGCAYRNTALRDAARRPNQHGPWTYESVVEDYHLTYVLRLEGWLCHMSPTVFCYTGSMTTLKSLWHQRIKWTAGTAGDLLRFGFNRLNYREWLQQSYLLLNLAFWVVWLALNIPQLATTGWHWSWWWQALTVLLVYSQVSHVRQMRGHNWRYDWKDILLAGLLIHAIVYNVLSLAWGLASWYKVIRGCMGDLWAPQYRAEGMEASEMKVGVGS